MQESFISICHVGPNSRCDAWPVKLDVYVSVGPPDWPLFRVCVAVFYKVRIILSDNTVCNTVMSEQFAGCEGIMCGRN